MLKSQHRCPENDYTLLRLIGSGTYGYVYAAKSVNKKTTTKNSNNNNHNNNNESNNSNNNNSNENDVNDKSKGTTKIYAVKIISIDTSQHLEREVLSMERLHHKNIVQFVESYVNKKDIWIVMEFCGVGSLRDIYSVIGRFKEKHIAFICREVSKVFEDI